MNKKNFTLNRFMAVLLLICGSLIGAEAKDRPVVPSNSPAFDLRDQFEKLHQFSFPRSKVTVLVVADRPGSKQLEGWIQPIYQRYQKKIDISGVADLGPVPARLQKFVRSSFQKQSDYPILLDWTGKVAASFGYTEKKANFYLIDRDGKILLHFVGVADQQAHEKIFQLIDQLLFR